MNYESEFRYVMEKALISIYGVKGEALYAYFQLRYRIWKWREGETPYISEIRNQIKFMMEELNLPSKEGKFLYKEELFIAGYSFENSLQSIMENWNFESSLKTVSNEKGIMVSLMDHIEMEWKSIKRKATNKSKPFKSTPTYPHYLQKNALQILNEVFQATPTAPSPLPYVYYPPDHNHYIRTMEEQSAMYVHSEELQRKDTLTIEEKDVEEFLRYRLDLIEEGMKYVAHQYVIPEGRIDLVAKDKNDQYVVIELKVVEDKELVWQSMYYRDALKAKMNLRNDVRMITLAHSYSDSLFSVLKQLPYVEIMKFTPFVERNVLKNMVIERLN